MLKKVELVLLVAVEYVFDRQQRVVLKIFINQSDIDLRKQSHQGLEDVEAELGLSDEVVIHRNISARLYGILDDVTVLCLSQKLANSLDHFLGHQPLLNLREFENNRNETRYMPLGRKRDITAELKTIEGNVNEVLVQQQVLTLLIGKDDHECFDEGVAENVLDGLGVGRLELLDVDVFELLSVNRLSSLIAALLGGVLLIILLDLR